MDRQALTVLVVGAAVVVALVAVFVTLALRARRRTAQELAAARADVSSLRDQVETLSRRLEEPAADVAAPSAAEFVITSLPSGEVAVPPEPAPPLTAGRFAAVAVGESAVRLLCLGYGVRRALSPESRNRIRFEVRQEVKRARRQRRRDLKEARRQLRARTSGGDRADVRSDAA